MSIKKFIQIKNIIKKKINKQFQKKILKNLNFIKILI